MLDETMRLSPHHEIVGELVWGDRMMAYCPAIHILAESPQEFAYELAAPFPCVCGVDLTHVLCAGGLCPRDRWHWHGAMFRSTSLSRRRRNELVSPSLSRLAMSSARVDAFPIASSWARTSPPKERIASAFSFGVLAGITTVTGTPRARPA